jgi:hypothetical protein
MQVSDFFFVKNQVGLIWPKPKHNTIKLKSLTFKSFSDFLFPGILLYLVSFSLSISLETSYSYYCRIIYMGTELLGLCFLEEALSIFYVRRSFICSYIKKRELKRTRGGV